LVEFELVALSASSVYVGISLMLSGPEGGFVSKISPGKKLVKSLRVEF
jgi:hypothetical protein